MVFLLGMRHGFDPDHLAAINSLTRLNLSPNPSVSRWAGIFFSFGHGLIVVLIALSVIFMLGMILTDGVNSLWVPRLLRRADALAARGLRAKR